MKTEKAGFTLIELLVVIAVIALLMGILMPALRKAKENAKRVVCSNQCRQVGAAITTYTEDYDGWLPWYGDQHHTYAVYRGDDDDSPYNGYLNVTEPPGVPEPPFDYWDTATNEGVAMKLACLYEGDYIVKPEIFYCASNRETLYKYGSYSDPEPWGSLPQNFNSDDTPSHNQWVRIGYTYYPTDKNPNMNVLKQAPYGASVKIIKVNPNIPYMTDIIRHKKQISHRAGKGYGINALFADGHVVFCNDTTLFENELWDDLEEEYEHTEDGGDRFLKYFFKVFNLIQP